MLHTINSTHKPVDSAHSEELKPLVHEAQNGNATAFRGIFEHLSDRLFGYTVSHTSNRDDALDIVQDTFIDLWHGLSKFEYRSDEAFYGFIFIILKRKISHFRTKTSMHQQLPLDENIIPQTYQVETEDYRYLTRHINALDSEYQDLLKLRYWSGMTFAEIAAVMNIKETTAKVWHHRALEELRSQLVES